MQSFSTTLFADANSEYTNSKYVIFGVPFDGTTSFKSGTRDAPSAIRSASYNLETYLSYHNIELPDVPFNDLGDLYCDCIPDNVVGQVEDVVTDIKKDGKLPVMIGGEHSVTIGAVKSLSPKWYVVCDAHFDLMNEFRGSPYNHDCVSARISEFIDNIIFVGVRSGSKDEFEQANRKYHVYTSEYISEHGINSVINDIVKLVGTDTVYLSIDADAIDCCYTPGLGTPEPFGMTPSDVRSVIREVSKTNVVGFDYVEVLPNDSGQTSIVSAHLIREFIAGHFVSHYS